MAEALRRCATAGERSGKELHQEGAVYFDDISCMGLHAWLIYLIYIFATQTQTSSSLETQFFGKSSTTFREISGSHIKDIHGR